MEHASPAAARPSAARERILATADRLFYEEGIHTVGINQIIAESAVTRATFYRHFPSKDDLINAYLEHRTRYDMEQVGGIIERHADDPRAALSELASALTRDDFAAMRRGCPFINASAEFVVGHEVRDYGTQIRAWVTARIEELLRRLDHRTPASTAQQLMMIRTGAVVSGALDHNGNLNDDFLDCWNLLVERGLQDPAA